MLFNLAAYTIYNSAKFNDHLNRPFVLDSKDTVQGFTIQLYTNEKTRGISFKIMFIQTFNNRTVINSTTMFRTSALVLGLVYGVYFKERLLKCEVRASTNTLPVLQSRGHKTFFSCLAPNIGRISYRLLHILQLVTDFTMPTIGFADVPPRKFRTSLPTLILIRVYVRDYRHRNGCGKWYSANR